MLILEVIPSKRWKNSKTGKTASIYGAVPYYSQEEKESWFIEKTGYTWLKNDGTVGLGRQPTETFEEAKRIMDRVNNNG